MSRFIAMLEEHGEPFSAETMRHLMLDMLDRLNAVDGTIEVRSRTSSAKTAPVSKLQSTMNYEAAWIADATNGVVTVRQIMVTPVTSLCPCSKEISRLRRAQPALTRDDVAPSGRPMTLEEQAAIAEEAGSCQLWARLKRADEKYVTEYAYDHPKFVEDLERDMAKALDDDERVQALPRRSRKLRIDPQPLRLRLDRTRQARLMHPKSVTQPVDRTDRTANPPTRLSGSVVAVVSVLNPPTRLTMLAQQKEAVSALIQKALAELSQPDAPVVLERPKSPSTATSPARPRSSSPAP